MNEKTVVSGTLTSPEILDTLWEEYRENPFSVFSVQRGIWFPLTVRNLLLDMSDTRESKHGYQVHRVASTIYKLTQATKSESPKGKPLTDENEADTGQPEREVLPVENAPRVSFFQRGDISSQTSHKSTIVDFHRHLRENAAWKLKIEHVRSLTGEAQAKAKVQLPAITPSVWIRDGKRTTTNTKNFVYTSLIQADFDHHPNPQQLMIELATDPHTHLVFASVREKAKAFFQVETVTCPNDHTAAFEAVRQHCETKEYGEIDKACKDVTRLCFISHDPNAILKEAQPLQWEPRQSMQMPLPRPTAAPTDTSKPTTDLKSALDAIPADEYQSHWIEIGCALFHSDIPDNDAFAMWDAWSQRSPKYNQTPDQMRQKWESFNTDRDRKHNLGYVYYLANQHGWQPPPRETYTPRKANTYSLTRQRLLRTQRLYGGRR